MKFGSAMKVVVAASLLTVATATQAASVTFKYLVDGGSITNVDKVFFNFHNVNQITNDLEVAYSDIQVNTISIGSELGIQFQYGGWTLAGANKHYDLAFDFQVMILPQYEQWITDNTLEFVGGTVADGQVIISETVRDASLNLLAGKLVYAQPGLTNYTDHQVFPGGPYALINISMDFALNTGNDPASVAFTSHFDQSFSQIPEPASMGLMLLGAAGMLCSRRRR